MPVERGRWEEVSETEECVKEENLASSPGSEAGS